jgi:hypothetical protein
MEKTLSYILEAEKALPFSSSGVFAHEAGHSQKIGVNLPPWGGDHARLGDKDHIHGFGKQASVPAKKISHTPLGLVSDNSAADLAGGHEGRSRVL